MHGDYQSAPIAPLACLPNLDGSIDESQMPVALGVPANFLVSPAGTTRTVDLAGTVNDAGQLVWAGNWSTDYADDQLAAITATDVSTKWYAASFPSAQFVLPFDPGDVTEAIYSEDSTTLWLWGFASSQQNPSNGETLLPYTNAVAAFQFPLQVGNQWTATGTVENGLIDGLPYDGVDSYTFDVEAAGILQLPELAFTQALSVHSQVTTVPVVGETTSVRQVSFLFQCFGEVARATSQPNEPNDDFTTAAQVRRLSLEQP
jgi:hypothetical protein